MLNLKYQAQFKKDIKLAMKRNWDLALLEEVTTLLQEGRKLPDHYMDHSLSGQWRGYRDCHIKGDWVLIYRIQEEKGTLSLVRTGSHSDLGL
ncbi:MAG: type II toxin-antitoxin system YafQ family toxin [Synergistaceae bacterium]|nr:type II toxin-antitoxin system YafQ family toxin [Synergistaceae bacterium]